MQFGLKHCRENGLRGVIYLSPFCSILDQSYLVYWGLLGEKNLVASWSTFDLDKDNTEELKAYQLLAERWDAPIILSTTVGFFESILSNKPSKLRKIHQLQNRCIILDEVQSLPKKFMTTILSILSELTDNWGCTTVLSSATNPAFEQLPEFKRSVIDVIPKPEVKALFSRMQRCNFIHWEKPTTLEAIANDIEQTTGSALVVVNSRKLAIEGFKLFRDRFDKVWHLSTYMCPVHREKVLAEAKSSLEKGEGVLISTSLIEAGVDLDCIRGYRQFTGIDSIYQSSGRINRNGLNPDAELIIFDIEGYKAKGDAKSRRDITRQLIKNYDIDNPNIFEEFFRLYYAGKRDESNIQELREGLKFQAIAKGFKMIDDNQESVIINYDKKADKLIQKIKYSPDELTKSEFREIGRYSASVYLQDSRLYKEVNGFKFWIGGYGKTGIEIYDDHDPIII